VVFKESDGRSGGLALFWKCEINLSLRSMGRMHIDVKEMVSNGVLPGSMVNLESTNRKKHGICCVLCIFKKNLLGYA
jgi:hypothetical protein